MALLQALVITLILIALSGCSSLPSKVNHTLEPVPERSASMLSTLTTSYTSAQKQQERTAILLQDTGWDALSQRLALIETAEQSIDIQYYIWNSDNSGHYLASRLKAAADRGVKVRVMLDDINLNERETLLIAIDSHPNISIRIFNPLPTRRGVAKWLSFLGDFSRLNRRMHNKSFTVDGAFSIVGGRNIGDEYFDLSQDINFKDRDVLVMGEVIPTIQQSFNDYWSSSWSYPVELLGTEEPTEYSQKLIFSDVHTPKFEHYPTLPEGQTTAYRFISEVMEKLMWVNAQFIYDQPVPENANDTSKPKTTAKFLAELSSNATQEILIESAYLIFDDRQLQAHQESIRDGVQIKALTNSMASNDLVTNHSGYAGRREDMLEHGLQLFELKPDTSLCNQSTKDIKKCAPTTAYGLHAKSIVYDNKTAVVGSFNFNLRSTYLNTESLLIINNETVSQKLATEITLAMDDTNSWRLRLKNGEVRWYSGEENWEHEPNTELIERMKSRLLQLLPIEKYL